jgi:TonB family protein
MPGSYPSNENYLSDYVSARKHGSVAGSYYFRQYELKRIYSRNFYRGLALALAIHAVFISLLFLYEPIYKKPPDVEELLPPVNTDYRVIQLKLIGTKASGMDVQGSGGGEGTIRENAGAAFESSVTSSTKNTISPHASIVPRSLQGPGMNDVAGVHRSTVYFDTVKGFRGLSRNSEGSGGESGSGIGKRTGSGGGFTDEPGFGGGLGDRFVPGNPANNSATGSPYRISWSGVPRTLLSGGEPEFPDGVQHGGTVKIRITVDPAGNIAAMVPVEKADSRLEEAAMSAMRTWRFSSLAQNYRQVDQQATATFIFRAE